VFAYQFAFNATGSADGTIQMVRSLDGGATWQRPIDLFTIKDGCEEVEPSIGR
jgi:Neuraminidase (sialidase)